MKKVEHKGMLWGVFVDPSYRRGGLARRLLQTVLACARESNLRQVHLAVNTGNVRARALYQSLGVEAYGVEPRAMRVDGRFFDDAHMTLLLD